MAKVVLSGFEPFDGYSINPSAELVKLLHGQRIHDHSVKGIVLPLDYKKADGILKEFISKEKPEYVLCCGQANRPVITLEYVGINILNTERADNYGNKPESHLIDPNAPAAYFSTLDVHNIVGILKENGIPAGVSYHAGTYGCNWILFSILHWLAIGNVQAKAVFVHVPPLPEQSIEKNDSSLATMPLGQEVDALKIIISSIH
ncbi:MAG: pyroglutamyl-peptidase I [Candidatus Thorarchaeota archaeon]